MFFNGVIRVEIFEVLGPIMVGPSSSHTAGAVKIGYITRKLLGEAPLKAEILLHGSFAATGVGHGTDKALVAGLLGMLADDMRIPDSFEIAKQHNLEISIGAINLKNVHPNTAVLKVVGKSNRILEVVASSVGGGAIKIGKIDGLEANFTGSNPTLIIHNIDQPGHVAEVTSTLSHNGINIATMHLYRDKRGGFAVMVIETDQNIPRESIQHLEHLEGVMKVTYLNLEDD
jgi:L-serine dehydratase